MLPETPTPPPLPAMPKKTPWLRYGCGAFLLAVLVIIASVAITIWWIQRPIKPVVLSPPEKAVVDQKLRILDSGNARNGTAQLANGGRASTTLPPASTSNESGQPYVQPYVPGSKTIRLSEREINGLLNLNTDLGKSVRLEFTRDAVNAYLAVRIPEDFPAGGGRMFRARGRFRISLGNGGSPYAILDDVTVFGVSLPKAWLGGIKGENLIGQAMGEGNGRPVLRGIKSLHVEPGALVIELED